MPWLWNRNSSAAVSKRHRIKNKIGPGMTQFVEKDPRLAIDIVVSMLKFWPVSLTSKQILYLNELEEILELVQPPEFQAIQKQLFKRVAICTYLHRVRLMQLLI